MDASRRPECKPARTPFASPAAAICALPQTEEPQPEHIMNLSLTPLVSLIAGILILIVPRLLNYIVAIYLIVIGILGLTGDVHLR
jgi:hypothetical protein